MPIGANTAGPLDLRAYYPLDAESVLTYLRTRGVFEGHLGGSASRWRARECGDGNLNLVFIVRGPSGGIVVKQALPYVRMVGESWPLSVRRNFFENTALREQGKWAGEFVPGVYHADDDMALFSMEYLTHHQVLRSELIKARTYPQVGTHLGLFLARSLFNTSEWRLPGHIKKERMAVFLANTAMCKISEDLIFDEPYFRASLNRHTSPQLDALATALTMDSHLKVAVQDMKWRFTNQPECLLHGDLHTGSVMVAPHDTRIIDPEFAFYGPIGFDVGVLVANFLMAYFSQSGHAVRSGERDEFQTYLLDQLVAIWSSFVHEFTLLWNERDSLTDANLCNQRLNIDSPAFSGLALTKRLQQIWQDAMGFAGCEMIRRIFGLAHIADFENIMNPDRRAQCEQRAISMARLLLTRRSLCRSMSQLTTLAHEGA